MYHLLIPGKLKILNQAFITRNSGSEMLILADWFDLHPEKANFAFSNHINTLIYYGKPTHCKHQ